MVKGAAIRGEPLDIMGRGIKEGTKGIEEGRGVWRAVGESTPGLKADTGVDIASIIQTKSNQKVVNAVIEQFDLNLRQGKYLSMKDAIDLNSKLGDAAFIETMKAKGVVATQLKRRMSKAIEDALDDDTHKLLWRTADDQFNKMYKKKTIHGLIYAAGRKNAPDLLVEKLDIPTIREMEDVLGTDSQAMHILREMTLTNVLDKSFEAGTYSTLLGTRRGSLR